MSTFTASLKNLFYPLVIALAVGTLWVYAWSRSLEDQIRPGWFPANDPTLFEKVSNGGDASATPVAVIPTR